ncbi:hypothetical protein Tco_1473801 [Tanacetum coccineum]
MKGKIPYLPLQMSGKEQQIYSFNDKVTRKLQALDPTHEIEVKEVDWLKEHNNKMEYESQQKSADSSHQGLEFTYQSLLLEEKIQSEDTRSRAEGKTTEIKHQMHRFKKLTLSILLYMIQEIADLPHCNNVTIADVAIDSTQSHDSDGQRGSSMWNKCLMKSNHLRWLWGRTKEDKSTEIRNREHTYCLGNVYLRKKVLNNEESFAASCSRIGSQIVPLSPDHRRKSSNREQRKALSGLKQAQEPGYDDKQPS